MLLGGVIIPNYDYILELKKGNNRTGVGQFFEFGVKLTSYFENRGKYQNSVRIVGDSPRNSCAKFQLLGLASILN